MYISHSILLEWLFCVYACEGFVCRSRAYKACFSDFSVFFRPSDRFYRLSHTIWDPFLTFVWLFWYKNRFFVRTFLCSLTVHIFLFYLPWSRKLRGLDPKKCSKSRIFTLKPRQKDLWLFCDINSRRKTAIWCRFERIFAVARLVCTPTRFLDGLQWTWMACNGRGLSYERADERVELAYCQAARRVQDVSNICPRCPPIIETKGLWPFWVHIQSVQSAEIQCVALKNDNKVIQ